MPKLIWGQTAQTRQSKLIVLEETRWMVVVFVALTEWFGSRAAISFRRGRRGVSLVKPVLISTYGR